MHPGKLFAQGVIFAVMAVSIHQISAVFSHARPSLHDAAPAHISARLPGARLPNVRHSQATVLRMRLAAFPSGAHFRAQHVDRTADDYIQDFAGAPRREDLYPQLHAYGSMYEDVELLPSGTSPNTRIEYTATVFPSVASARAAYRADAANITSMNGDSDGNGPCIAKLALHLHMPTAIDAAYWPASPLAGAGADAKVVFQFGNVEVEAYSATEGENNPSDTCRRVERYGAWVASTVAHRVQHSVG